MSVTFHKGDDGIAVLTLDMPGRSTNVLNDELMGPLDAALKRVEGDASIRGVILTSGKKDFVVGADLEKVYAIHDPREAFELAEAYKAFLRRIERLGRPVVAALNGTALGGGLELALACHYRVALDVPTLRVGTPEVKLGLLPGGGGTQRLPRLIGMQAAAPLLLEGKELRAAEAKGLGVVHELAKDQTELLAKARAFIDQNPKPQQPWDKQGFKYPGGDSRSPQVAQMMSLAPSVTNDKTHGNYPAPILILACVYEGGLVDFDAALTLESRYFAQCVISPVSKNLITTLWFQLQSVQKGRSRPEGIDRAQVKKLGILGAGMMGAGIAYVAAKANIQVVLLDATQEQADKGKEYSANLLDGAIKKGRQTAEGKATLLGRILATTRYEDLDGCDLVVEAVFEDRTIKADVTKRAEARLSPEAVFASNTSTLPITGLAEASVRPAKFIGLHFFSPVDKMELVEIIVGEQTAPETLARGFDFVRQINKTPIVVRDSRGFYTSRVFATYVMEGAALLAEGQHPRSIEAAGLKAGMPVGPLALLDEVNLGTAWRIERQNQKDAERTGSAVMRHPGSLVVGKMVEELKRPGKKEKQGFYDYPEGAQKRLWPGLREHFGSSEPAYAQTDMVDRLLFAQANEAAKCFAEGVVRSVADANVGSIFGWGFAPFHGGALQFINSYGVARFVERARELARKYGERFAPANVLVEMAAKGETFHA
ncbi:MAG: 3-hydroxyacyl-CoA dehydrogenase NAD-binding domain-containing protein [Myxococcales bacterium]